MKQNILARLKNSASVLSGEALSSDLGISRVSIWKHIKKLQELGYPIESTPKGYRMKKKPDLLYPWEFGKRESLVHFYPVVSSTMDIAREMARNGCPSFTVVVADRQEKGKGRLDRQWLSESGGLYVTIVIRPDIPPTMSTRVTLAAAVDMANTLKSLFSIDAQLKWPNDILVSGRKICGLLSQMEADSDRVTYLNIGVGLNVNNDPTANIPNSVSLEELCGKSLLRQEILNEFLDRLEKRIDDNGFTSVIAEWKQLSSTLNKRVTIATTQSTIEGIATDVDDNGALLLKMEDGTIRTVMHGDCFY